METLLYIFLVMITSVDHVEWCRARRVFIYDLDDDNDFFYNDN